MKEINVFIILLIVFAAMPFGILGHELWHLAFAMMNGGTPSALCVNFDGEKFASAISEYPGEYFSCKLCESRIVDEYIAWIITIGISLLMIYLFSKKYLKLIE